MLPAFIRWPLNFVRSVWVLSWTAICISTALVVFALSRSTRIALGMARWMWAPGILAVGPYRYQAEGVDAIDWSRPYFVVSNHQSYLDIPLLFRVLPVNLHFVVKNELRHAPFLAWYIRAMGMIFVDRSNPEAARRSIERTAQAARDGKTILLFPEGTRTRDGEVQRFKSGMLAAAASGKVPVIPVAVEGPGRGLPRNWFRCRREPLYVLVGEPIATDGYDIGDRRQLADHVYRQVKALHRRLQLEVHGAPPQGESTQGEVSEP